MRWLKDTIKNWLRSRGYFITWVPDRQLTGFDLEEDMERLLGTNEPCIFDVGANEGQTIEMMRRVFRSPSVVSFEPSPAVFEKLQAAYGHRKDVKLINAGLGISPGQMQFHEYESSVLNSALEIARGPDSPFKDKKKIRTVDVTVETVDRMIQQHSPGGLDLLKIDTQGFDLQVLRGAEESLRGGLIRHVLVELNFSPLYEGQAGHEEVLSFLAGHGYRLVDFYEKHRAGGALSWCTALLARNTTGA